MKDRTIASKRWTIPNLDLPVYPGDKIVVKRRLW